MKYSVLSFFLFSAIQVFSQKSVTLPIDAAHSVISFSVGFAGGITSIDGRFNKFIGELGYKNESDPTTLFANVKIDVSSINTGDSDRDSDLKGETFFNTKAFPEIRFVSNKVSKSKDGFIISGTFSMLGVTKQLDIPFMFSHTTPVAWVFGEPRIAAKANLILDRAEFGIPKRGWDNMIPTLGAMALSKEVNITLVIQGVGPGLGAQLFETVNTNGVVAAVEQYKIMEKENNGNETYEFNANALLGVTMQLIQMNKFQEAVEISKFNTIHYPDTHVSFYGLALASEKAGDKKSAIDNLEKALKIKPDFQRGKKLLNRLKN